MKAYKVIVPMWSGMPTIEEIEIEKVIDLNRYFDKDGIMQDRYRVYRLSNEDKETWYSSAVYPTQEEAITALQNKLRMALEHEEKSLADCIEKIRLLRKQQYHINSKADGRN